jgi:hypothetical protein
MRRQIPDFGSILEKVGQLGMSAVTRIEVLKSTDVFYLLEGIVERY